MSAKSRPYWPKGTTRDIFALDRAKGESKPTKKRGVLSESAAETVAVPPVGTRYVVDHGKDSRVILEYVGLNPDAEFETADAHLIRTVESFHGAAPVGTVNVIDVLWFDQHKRIR